MHWRSLCHRLADVDQLARALRGDHGRGSRPGLVRRPKRRDRRDLRVEDEAPRRLHGAARVVEQSRAVHLMAAGPINHVVIIVKENHGYDNYFGTYPGGNGAAMTHSPNPPPRDPDHRHAAWLSRDTTAPRVQFQQGDIPHYWSYANQFTLYHTDVAGPSHPNHLMLIMADQAL